jgi:hypothetical protein
VTSLLNALLPPPGLLTISFPSDAWNTLCPPSWGDWALLEVQALVYRPPAPGRGLSASSPIPIHSGSNPLGCREYICFTHHWFLFVLLVETGSHYVAQAGLELVIILPQSPECWDYRYLLPCPAQNGGFYFYFHFLKVSFARVNMHGLDDSD